MAILLSTLLALHVIAPQDSVRRRGVAPPARIPVTAEHLATAFRDSTARTLLRHGREARSAQDSAIVSYDAMSYQRMSASIKAGSIGRERVLYRTESAAHVRWHRD